MRSLLRFIVRFHLFFVFLLFEALALAMLFKNNSYQRSKMAVFTRNISASYQEKATSVKDYLMLKKRNQELLEENEYLVQRLTKLENIVNQIDPKHQPFDSQYVYTHCKITNNSTNKQYNYITLNKGRADGIQPEMAVISKDGMVGIVRGVSENFSTVLPILNQKFRTSAMIKKNGYYGSMEWQGRNYTQAILKEIPHHVDIVNGDTIITSGYSNIFPKGILIGFAEDYKLVEGNFYQINVNLSTDFKNLSYVYVIENKLRNEQIQLEDSTIRNEY